MRASEFYSAGVGNICKCACIKSPNNPSEKYLFAKDRNYVYILSGSGIMSHPEVGSDLPFTAGSLFDVRQFQGAGYTVALPETDSAFWIGFNLRSPEVDYTVTKLDIGETLYSAPENKRASVVVISGSLIVASKQLEEGNFAYLPKGQEVAINVSNHSLAFLLEEL